MSLHDILLETHTKRLPVPNWDGHINEAGLEIIKRFEGWRSSPYLCAAARPTIGWGSCWDDKGDPVTLDHPSITKEQGEHLLKREVRHVEKAIRRSVKTFLNENQFSACCSLAYNIGSGNFFRSSLRQKLSRGDIEGASNEFPKWRRAGGRILKGLVIRRGFERRLFLL